MKKNVLIALSLVLTLGFYSCKKDADVASTITDPLTAQGLNGTKISGIKSGEPVAFAYNKTGVTASSVIWKIVPNAGVSKSVRDNKATFKFSKPGSYLITTSSGSFADSLVVKVDSVKYTGIDTTTYNGGGKNYDSTIVSYRKDTTTSLIGLDDLIITPTKADSLGTSKSGLILNASTSLSYPSAYPQLNAQLSYLSNTSFAVDYKGITIYSSWPGYATAQTWTTLPIATDGDFDLQIAASGKIYKGKVNKKGTTYTITWPYTSGVIISPLVIK